MHIPFKFLTLHLLSLGWIMSCTQALATCESKPVLDSDGKYVACEIFMNSELKETLGSDQCDQGQCKTYCADLHKSKGEFTASCHTSNLESNFSNLIKEADHAKSLAQSQQAQVNFGTKKDEIKKLIEIATQLKHLEHGMQRITLNGKLVPISFQRNRRDLTFDIDTPEKQANCFRLSTQPESRTGHLAYIHPDFKENGKTCKEIYGFSGNDLMGLVDSIAVTMNLKYLTVKDDSTISCRPNSNRTESSSDKATLRTARMFTRGNTWYGSKGFYPNGLSTELYDSFVDTLGNISLGRYLKCLKDEGKSSELEKWALLYQNQYPNDQMITLNKFMSWMFREKCTEFDQVVALLTQAKSLPESKDLNCKNTDISNGLILFQRMSRFATKFYDQEATSPLGTTPTAPIIEFISKTKHR